MLILCIYIKYFSSIIHMCLILCSSFFSLIFIFVLRFVCFLFTVLPVHSSVFWHVHFPVRITNSEIVFFQFNNVHLIFSVYFNFILKCCILFFRFSSILLNKSRIIKFILTNLSANSDIWTTSWFDSCI